MKSHRNYSVNTSAAGYVHRISSRVLCRCACSLGSVYLYPSKYKEDKAIVVCNHDLHCTASMHVLECMRLDN